MVHAPSYCGKTEWAHSLFKRPLELKVGTLQHFPEAMRRFDREKFDGLVLDDVRDLTFLGDHQEKLQGKYSGAVDLPRLLVVSVLTGATFSECLWW